MDLRNTRQQPDEHDARIEQLLVAHYSKFFQWAMALTRGDAGKAEEIVQEFCLYLALTRPDLRHVANLDGYLYISLRHLYQSSLVRSTREAMRVIHVAEYDSLPMALSDRQGGDTLERQNDLRRICSYAVWRKDQSKSFSYFVLHFFHGYSRSEVAEMSGASLATIYNKLHNARTEIRSHLEDSSRLKVITRGVAPQPVLLWNRISAPDFFRELRATILCARKSPCLPEQELLAVYRASRLKPLSCELLSHLASCERCLDLVDSNFRRPALRDREPLDSTESHQGAEQRQRSAAKRSAEPVLQALRARLSEIYEHRPRTLGIAVNGRIVALHDVQGARSILAARIDLPEKARFVEVFSEQDIRLALLDVSAEPPQGEHSIAQRVQLSDERWLELNLAFDGLGLNSEVTYYDPVLGMAAEAADLDEADKGAVPALRDSPPLNAAPAKSRHSYFRWLQSLIPSPALAWALGLLAVFCTAGYFVYRQANAPFTAQQVLDRSIKLEAARINGKTEHQTLRVEEVSAAGQITQKGTIEVLRDGNGSRFLRQFYDAQHHLMAAEWQVDEKSHHAYPRKYRSELASIPWTENLSTRAFAKLGKQPPQLQRFAGGYRLTVQGATATQPHLVEAALVLTKRFVPVQEDFQFRNGAGTYRVRFVQLQVSYRLSSDIPNKAFELLSAPDVYGSSTSSLTRDGSAEQLASLDIAVLYQLSQMNADTGIPIEVRRTPDGHLLIVGSIADASLRNDLVARLHTLPDHQLLEVNLASQGGAASSSLQSLRSSSGPLHVYQAEESTPLADTLIRAPFVQQGLSGNQLNESVLQFSSGVLALSQHALQNAYALNRLGKAISISGANTLDTNSLEQWTQMMTRHASLLHAELFSLRAQLKSILPVQQSVPQISEPSMEIDNTVAFAKASGRLLDQVETLNEKIEGAFASQGAIVDSQSAVSTVAAITGMLPLREASEVDALAKHLSQADADIRSAEGASPRTEHKIQR